MKTTTYKRNTKIIRVSEKTNAKAKALSIASGKTKLSIIEAAVDAMSKRVLKK